MTVLERFAPPGNLTELNDDDAEAWHETVKNMFGRLTGDFPQLYDPTIADTPDDHRRVDIEWVAFPARLLPETSTDEERWAMADEDRRQQDEYCEWSVLRDDDGKITRVTFTSEVREYYNHLAVSDPDQLVALYQELVSPDVTLDDLLLEQGPYSSANDWNFSTDGAIAHLAQENNNLWAAVSLVAEATIPRHDERGPITTKGVLAHCAGLGDPSRNSDPQIAAKVNGAARAGNEVTLADPVGLYLDGIATTGMKTPDDADPADFWIVERGTEEHTLRARFEVPDDLDYDVGDITLNGRPINFGAQLADRVTVRITGVVKPGNHRPDSQPCEPQSG